MKFSGKRFSEKDESYIGAQAAPSAAVFKEIHSTRDWVEHSIPARFMSQVAATPDRPAVWSENGTLTYVELNRYSNRISDSILQRSRPGRQAVCLLLEHTDHVPAAILGVLKSGKFYATLDPDYPRERNEYLLKDTQARLILVSDRTLNLCKSLVSDANRIINIDRLPDDASVHDPQLRVKPDNIAYIVYTSGSTGKPKGAVLTHRSVLHKTVRQASGLQIYPDDRVGLLFSYNFGPAADNLLGALLHGAAVYPFDIRNESPVRLLEWLGQEEITIFHIVPTFFRHLVSMMRGDENFPKLRLIRLSGETIYGNDVRLFQKHFAGNCILHVGFGSTETGALLHDSYDSERLCNDSILPSGYPTEDMQVEIRLDSGAVAEPGTVGEIVVKSRFMFSGYWRHPDLTAEVLKPDPDGNPEQTYFMRDLGTLLPDGRVMHRGRKDAQVKIRGHRVEIGEVERALLETPGVSETAVIPIDADEGKKQLIAYVVRSESATMPMSSLRKRLQTRIPRYMIPAHFVSLDSLPVTITGKIDRAALANRPLPRQKEKRLSPRDFIEAQLAAIWEDLLQIDGIGVNDDFFELGGDSLLAMKLTFAIEDIYERRVNLGNFPTEITIESLANVLELNEHENLQRSILEIQSSGTKSPLYFCHGDYISGGAFCRNLSRHLGPQQPFYAIPPHGLDGGQLPQTIEAMAADRVKALRDLQPEGPYKLGGFCWGGILALEMARQLQQQGAEVESLIVIDTVPKNISLRPLRRLIRRLSSWFSLSEEAELSLFRSCRRLAITLRRARRVGRIYRQLPVKLRLWHTNNLAPFAYSDSNESNNAWMEEGVIPADRHSRFATYSSITQNYVAEPYSGKVVCFRSSRYQDKFPDYMMANWQRVSPDVESCSIAGDHLTCVTKHADDLARKMWPYL